mmetsp:Transcript_12329/g.23376  ORF Transcript_12329/g.23376 Transcript_12329/m.23376 type:complete len:203 (+) Transcript_12329:546-1154(+)
MGSLEAHLVCVRPHAADQLLIPHPKLAFKLPAALDEMSARVSPWASRRNIRMLLRGGRGAWGGGRCARRGPRLRLHDVPGVVLPGVGLGSDALRRPHSPHPLAVLQVPLVHSPVRLAVHLGALPVYKAQLFLTGHVGVVADRGVHAPPRVVQRRRLGAAPRPALAPNLSGLARRDLARLSACVALHQAPAPAQRLLAHSGPA